MYTKNIIFYAYKNVVRKQDAFYLLGKAPNVDRKANLTSIRMTIVDDCSGYKIFADEHKSGWSAGITGDFGCVEGKHIIN
jgi:hypothetical protein